jgi:hypothetical protein
MNDSSDKSALDDSRLRRAAGAMLDGSIARHMHLPQEQDLRGSAIVFLRHILTTKCLAAEGRLSAGDRPRHRCESSS